MRLFELLDKLMNNENLYAIKDESMFGVRYRKHSGFMICGRNGTYVEHPYTFDKEMTEDDSWVIKSAVIPKYKIGDRFVVNAIQESKVSWDSIIWNCVYNAVGTISNIKYDDQYIYTLIYKDYLSEKGTLTKEISEKELSTYDMVVSQDN